jgi:glucose 1-dehydrogenase
VRGGTIINLSSVNGIMAIPNQTPYNVSKGGVDQLTRNTALALAPHKIRVNGIGPGSILTDMLKVVMDNDESRARILSRTPLGRCGEVTEIASIAVFLAGQASSYVTGQTIYADGGRMALNYTVPAQA